MSFIITPLRWVVDLLYSWVGSYGVAIILFTLAVKLVLLPLDIKQRHSMRKMQDIQPKIEEINKKYEKDPEKRSAKTMELYKKEKVNPMGGCLPMLIQLPILYAMFAVMRHIAGEQAVLMGQQVTQGLPFEPESFLWIRNIWQPDNGLSAVVQSGASFLATPDLHKLLYLQNNPEIWEKLMDMGIAARAYFVDNDGVMQATYRFLTSESAIAAYDQAVQPFIDLYAGYNNGWFILPVLSGVSQFLASWLMQKNQPKTDNPAASSGKMMLYIFPIMSFVFCLSYNAAFAIYWTLSSMLMLLMNLYMIKKYPIAPVVKEEKKE